MTYQIPFRPVPTARLMVTACLSALLGTAVAFAQTPSTPATLNEKTVNTKADAKESVVTLAGGCFWCTEAVFERMQGVNDVVSGYIGGKMTNPDYKSVCTGNTGHAEAVEVYYDPAVTTYEELLEVFFKTHDPTSLDRQGADVGSQYRSAIFFHDDAEKNAAAAYIAKLNASREFGGRIVTTLEPAATFYPAEEYHQDYFRKNPNEGYCRAVVRTKVKKFENVFKDKVKKD